MDTVASTGHHHLSADHDLDHTRLDEHGRALGPPEKFGEIFYFYFLFYFRSMIFLNIHITQILN